MRSLFRRLRFKVMSRIYHFTLSERKEDTCVRLHKSMYSAWRGIIFRSQFLQCQVSLAHVIFSSCPLLECSPFTFQKRKGILKEEERRVHTSYVTWLVLQSCNGMLYARQKGGGVLFPDTPSVFMVPVALSTTLRFTWHIHSFYEFAGESHSTWSVKKILLHWDLWRSCF